MGHEMVLHFRHPHSYSHEGLRDHTRKAASNLVDALQRNACLTEERAWEIATAGFIEAIADKLAEYDRPEAGARDVCRDLLCQVETRVRARDTGDGA